MELFSEREQRGSNRVMEQWFIEKGIHFITPALQYPTLSLSNPETAFALFKKRAQWRQIISAGLQRDRINIVPPERAQQLRFESSDEICKNSSRLAICRIDLDLFACLGILQRNDADVWQRSLAFVPDLNCYEIVPPPAHRERPREIRRLKIRDEKYNRSGESQSCSDNQVPARAPCHVPVVRKTEFLE